MALYEGGDRARTGPYWRRQMHTTLPGERTGQELAAINALRAQMGQPPLGGPAQHTALTPAPSPFAANISALVAALAASGGRAGRQIGVAGPVRSNPGLQAAYGAAIPRPPASPGIQPQAWLSPPPLRPRAPRPMQPLHRAIIKPLRRAYSY